MISEKSNIKEKNVTGSSDNVWFVRAFYVITLCINQCVIFGTFLGKYKSTSTVNSASK